jgi:REP element-mobilizing transposase RayT
LPLHVTLKMRPEVWNLRSRRCFSILEKAFLASLAHAPRSRVAQFSIQGDHIHMLVEAGDRLVLGRMMQAMSIRMARGLNRVMNQRRGPVFADRYHARCLRTPTETRAALVYVLQNARKHLAQHGHVLSPRWTDDQYSSAPWFTGWREPGQSPPARPPPVTPAATWLLDRGWRDRGGGTISRAETPR